MEEAVQSQRRSDGICIYHVKRASQWDQPSTWYMGMNGWRGRTDHRRLTSEFIFILLKSRCNCLVQLYYVTFLVWLGGWEGAKHARNIGKV